MVVKTNCGGKVYLGNNISLGLSRTDLSLQIATA
jgi:hypothetical protein